MSEITEIKENLQRVLFYLENDAKTGKKGLVTEVNDIKADMDKLKGSLSEFVTEHRKTQAVKAAKLGVWGMVGGAVITFLTWLINVFK